MLYRIIFGLFSILTASACAGEALYVVATVPDLGDLAQRIGGEAVNVSVLAKGKEDPHFVEAKPSFVKLMAGADVFIQCGLDLEVGYVPALQRAANNARIQPSGAGFIDTSESVQALEVPQGTVDRSMGDVHPYGNPHYLVDPIYGLKAAHLIMEKFSKLRPEKKEVFEKNFEKFKQKIAEFLVGEKLAAKYDIEKLARLQELGGLFDFLKEQNDLETLSGAWGKLRSYQGVKAVADHNLWPYFARRFGIQLVAYLEPKPGISPSTKHLAQVVQTMKSEGVRILLHSPYFDEKPCRFVTEQTNAKAVLMANQVGAVDRAQDYLALMQYSVDRLLAALESKP